jgi:hypothetical protein
MTMFPEGVRGNKKRKEDQLRLTKEIRKHLPTKKDHEIMNILGIPNSTFYRYKSLIHREDKELWSKVRFETLESRLLRIHQTLEDSFRISRGMAFNEKARPMDRIKASKRMVNAQYNILRLLKMGPNFEYYEFF